MTILVNEIHIRGHLKKSIILFAADRRITVNGEFHSNRKKIFEIPYLNAGIGYFGLAQINDQEFLSGWIPNFIRNTSGVKSLVGFAQCLCDELNQVVDNDLLVSNASGLHICGYSNFNLPELWFVRNFHDMKGHVYRDFRTVYTISEDFLSRDAKKFGFNGENPELTQSGTQYYVNGDIRPFHSIWHRLDRFLMEMYTYPDFTQPNTPTEYKLVAEWKIKVISSFYKQFAKKEIIGTPIDTFVLVP